MAGIDDFIAEADDWGVDPRLARAFLAGPVVACLALAAAVIVRPLFDFLTAEDSVLEWLQVCGFATAAVAAAIVAGRLRARSRTALSFFVLLSAGNVFITGEELAWGQRLLGLETPDPLARVNHQNEITLHNIKGGISVQFLFNLAVLTIGVVGALLPWLLRNSRLRTRLDVRLTLPPRFLGAAFAMAGGYRLGRLLLPWRRPVLIRYGEITELCLAFAFAAFAVLSISRARRLVAHGPAALEPPSDPAPLAASQSPASERRSGELAT